MIRKGLLASVALACGLFSGVARPPPRAMQPGMRRWRSSSRRRSPQTPVFAVYAGRHEFDGQLPDFSAAVLAAKRSRRLEAAKRARWPSIPRSLDADRRVERDYLLSVIEKALFWQSEAEWPYRNPAFYFDAIDPEIYLSKPYAPLDQRMRGFIAYAESDAARRAADPRQPAHAAAPSRCIDYGVKAFGGYAEFFAKDVPSRLRVGQRSAAAGGAGRGDEGCVEGHAGTGGLARGATRHGDAGLRPGPEALRAHARGDGAGDGAARQAGGRRARGHGPQPQGVARSCAPSTRRGRACMPASTR